MQAKILWADDEIDLLKPHILFLEQKGYSVETVNNGGEAVDKCREQLFDIVFLDENMPGISGLDALTKIKEIRPMIPIVMITKSEEESIMEEAIGGKIADYLIKPVNPNQILLSIKKNLDHSKLVSNKTNSSYQQEFRQIAMELNQRLDADEWASLFKRLTYWDIQFQSIEEQGMKEVLEMQKKEANQQFCRFIEDNYCDWLNGTEDAPQLIHTLFKNKINPLLKEPVFLIVIDNLRYDQWQVLRPTLSNYFNFDKEEIAYSILPTATHYARNALFSGLLPSEIAKKYPNYWSSESEDGGKNMYEKELLTENLKRLGKNIKMSYHKITNIDAGKKLNDQFSQILNNDLNVIVYNFVDMLSHARTEMKVIKELADDEAAYRSLTESWFEHSPLLDIFKNIAKAGIKVVITTDHGTVKVNEAIKIVGPKDTNTNLRYKTGKNLDYNEKEVFRIKNPDDAFLPKENLSSEYVFCKTDGFFVYPNNFNHFLKHYKDTFQHGGISMEEMLIPYVEMTPKSK
ncbi:MAG: bifunctional response regulator/alkaline phosphatase family protein [Crocinitomicaceae bacterium]|nr:bifunctional response regulator/alkaline phosphatase family protein [Crocinitomicaceae bacterium]